jgi:hypothetical protein
MKTKNNFTCEAAVPVQDSKEIKLRKCGAPAIYFVGAFQETVCESCKNYLKNSPRFKGYNFDKINSQKNAR